MILTSEQLRFLNVVEDGKNVFLTGPGGTGKSMLINLAVENLTKEKKKVAVTGSTGVAAVNVKGCTLHHLLGCGIINEALPAEALCDAAQKKGKRKGTRERLTRLDALIIDEVSMLSTALFYYADQLCRAARSRGSVPFGGLQLILCGDFLQLPPISQTLDGQVIPLYKSSMWANTVDVTVYLTHLFRQRHSEFQQLLNRLRYGQLTDQDRRLLSQRVKIVPDPTHPPLRLEPRRQKVKEGNDEQLCKLKDPLYTFEASVFPRRLTDREYDQLADDYPSYAAEDDSSTAAGQLIDTLRRAEPVDYHLQLKVGARVLLAANLSLERGLCNGALGWVREIIVAEDPGESSHGEDDSADDEIPVEKKKPRSGKKSTHNPTEQEPQPDETSYTYKIPTEEACRDNVLVKVEFDNGVVETIRPHEWSMTKEPWEARYVQLPLRLAWYLTIHKAQGITSPVHVNLSMEVFAPGQAYVALSRAPSLKDVYITSFNPSVCRADPTAVRYYEDLEIEQGNPPCISSTDEPLAKKRKVESQRDEPNDEENA
jgi:ATP-dependent DNA helicase PIF1